jgi:hypothetical protein
MSEQPKNPQWYHIIKREWGVEADQRVWADGIYAVGQGFLHGRLIRLSLGDQVVAEFPARKVHRWFVSNSWFY